MRHYALKGNGEIKGKGPFALTPSPSFKPSFASFSSLRPERVPKQFKASDINEVAKFTTKAPVYFTITQEHREGTILIIMGGS
jgi:hypothetical protein